MTRIRAFRISLHHLIVAGWITTASVFFGGYAGATESAEQSVSFNQTIRPILSNHCFQCHGPDGEDRKAGVRLDIPDEVDLDEVLDRISSDDPDMVMPPVELNKPLSDQQVTQLQRWIEQGAEYEQHWSFVPPREHPVPTVDDNTWNRHAIDRFVLDKLQQQRLPHQPSADKRTLIRRLSLDLTGLPPTTDEVHAFVHDESLEAYENLVERLLAKPQFGEHMARYWLDLVRFADTNGLHHDHYREMTPYRDWVIRSFNENLPFDQFVMWQIAGDLYDDPSIEQQIASGFNRLHLIIDRGTALPEESFNRNVVDRVSSVGTAFLGLTLECAVCHDHKYDPITQRDFYQMYAFFNNFDGGPETGGRNGLDFKRGLQPPYLELPSEEQEKQLAAIDVELDRLTAEHQTLQSDAKLKDGERSEQVAKSIEKVRARRDALIESIPATLVMKERDEVRPAHLLIRGNYDQPGDVVQRDTPGFLPPLDDVIDGPGDGVKTRMDLARWLVAPTNPLTARVAVNRFWQQVFGVGLVQTSEDFGAQGGSPSHPELLDHLTLQFIRSGWDVKALIRSIVLSETYAQSSKANREQFVSDPTNRMLGRGSRYRLDGEVIRDQVLATSGLLNPELYGKSVKPPQPEGLWKIVAMPSSYPRIFEPDQGSQIYRRSVYSFWKRGLPPPQMTIFDAPTRESCTARRERTNTPLQALVLMNEQEYFHAALHLANDLLQRADLEDRRRIEIAYETITSHQPSESVLNRCTVALDHFRAVYRDDVDAADQMIAANRRSGEDHTYDSDQRIELASLTMLVHSLLNLDETKTRE
ncbi:PSD1 and planctomycete cytochrome C domain-containing protein [Stieleria sp. TO1_6]|uniref:PSD1 and planctomycete cytochrome C domain-containing protein n=1 Tax=Stieleria tagensis TaxID=2956795 RepID=UPI00209A8FC4|nr:PSD1 and planctomycete cytochrome C domain-containing protein [Stieleria tagensis]MCO8122188.1 PSD1 and planctomycete cytochrome C domain-containing protein [Stieleria tagensis]